ncbi:GNAT family N-acetyltransferase [Nonomuraea sp. KC401]|uniref:GNAT family N-acetyltransferase n=1 Tax=unclassified Nonomuraea TaxID=2593643 RepID=UPI0010FD69D0|nr:MULTISPECIES: GNAT family N-acetyltransferase [unclassified Nonomuraea]NBF00392.1 GNAT family N-acetyltransferase [Nonomuraea sp. K271]TLF83459.1 GNAT family N-acetyltransferase [Nonomuraea sp. KC401]
MLPPDVISTGSLILRPPAEPDTEAIVMTCDDPVSARFLPLLPSPYRAEDARDHLGRVAATWREGGAEFAIIENGRYAGSIGVTPPDRWGVTGIGYLVAPWARGRNVAATAARAVTDWLFDHGVRRVELQTEVENVASLRVAYKAGFREEGRRRDAKRLRDGRDADFVTFARLPGDVMVAEPYLPLFDGGELTDGVVALEPLAAEDAMDFHRMMAEPSVAAYSVGPPATLEENQRRCRYTGYWWVSGQRVELAVRDAASRAFAGHVQLTQVVPALGQAMIGYSLAPEYRRKGLMTRAVRLLVDWAFASTPLHRIVAGTEAGNTASQAVLERAGFGREGVHRQLLPQPDGTWADDVAWARLRPAVPVGGKS